MANNDFIGIYDNSVSQELCNELVKWFDLCSEKNFTLYNMPFSSGETKTSFRSDEAMTVPSGIKPDSYPVSFMSLPSKICDAFWDVLGNCLENYMNEYDMGTMRLSCVNFKIHKVKEGQGYHVWHYETEIVQTQYRILAWMTYLTVPEEGGETEFLYQSKRIEPVVGKTLIWPAHFTHLHRGNPPLKGEKYYITGWFERN
jgi:hypothetical protein